MKTLEILNDIKNNGIPTSLICQKCKKSVSIEGFHKDSTKRWGIATRCKQCVKSNTKTYWEQNKEGMREANRKYQKQNRGKIKEKTNERKKLIYDAYGNKCACCGEKNPGFFTIDHVNNNGNVERKNNIQGDTLYRKIILDNFPDTYQILCWNCNCGKYRNQGRCPHKTT